MFFQNRFLTEVRHRVKIKIDELALVKAQLGSVLDKCLLQAPNMLFVERVGVGGHGRAFRQHIETGEKPEDRIEGMIPDMGVALCADQFQGEKGK